MGRPKKKSPVTEKPADENQQVISVTDETPADNGVSKIEVKEIPVDEIGDKLIDGMPEMKPGEVRGIIETAEPPPDFEPPTDTAPTGEKKKRGRPPGKSTKEKAKEQAGAAAVMAHDPSNPDKYDAAAEMYVDGAIFAAASFVSGEWMPRKEGEENQIKKSLAQFMRLKQVEEPPAWVVLLGSIAIYAAPRLTMPETKAKIGKLFGKEEPKDPKELPPPIGNENTKNESDKK